MRNMRALPFDSVDELMGSLEDLSLNQTRATASVRLAGGMNTRSKEYQQAFRSKQKGGIMTVTADPSRMKPRNLVEFMLFSERRVGLGEIIKIHHFMSCLTPVSKELSLIHI